MIRESVTEAIVYLPCRGKSHGSRDSEGAWRRQPSTKVNHTGVQHTLPFKFQVPTKHRHFFVVEYSDDLQRKDQRCTTPIGLVILPLLKSCSNMIMNWIVYGNLTLTT